MNTKQSARQAERDGAVPLRDGARCPGSPLQHGAAVVQEPQNVAGE